MRPVTFPGSNLTIAKNQPQYLPMPARMESDYATSGRLTFCWGLTWRERLAVLLHGRIWHEVLTFNQPLQPQYLSTRRTPEVKP